MFRDSRKLQTFDEDDIVRYSMGLDVPIVGLVRDRIEYREMREIALIYGAALGLPRTKAPEPGAEPVPSAEAPKPEDVPQGATGTVAGKDRQVA